MLTWGSLDDYKHFLPRIFELIAACESPYEEWILFEKLNKADWQTWSNEEVTALSFYFLSLWEKLLTTEYREAYFSDYFAAISNVYPNFSQLLKVWEANFFSCGTTNLIRYVSENCDFLVNKQKLPGWKPSRKYGEEFCKWINSENIILHLKQQINLSESIELEYQISWLLSSLRHQKTFRTERSI